MNNSSFCQYYKAKIKKETTWFVSGVLRNESNTVLERCRDKTTCEFEFFVPEDTEPHFLKIMNFLTTNGFVSGLTKLENRLFSNSL